MKPKLLLHACCAPCSIYVLKKLSADWQVTIFFYDPNIHPKEEYDKRRDELKKYAEKIGINFEEGEYDVDVWLEKTKGLELEPERGRRCIICFDIRLSKTAIKAKQENYDAFATVMSISPHKDYQALSRVGNRLAHKFNILFLDGNWKKQGGFIQALALSKAEGFYRQDYCGCIYSQAAREKIKSAKQHEHQTV